MGLAAASQPETRASDGTVVCPRCRCRLPRGEEYVPVVFSDDEFTWCLPCWSSDEEMERVLQAHGLLGDQSARVA